MSLSIYLAVPLMALLGILQTAVLPRFPIAGLVPQIPLLVALAWGLLHGVNEGVLWAFVAGFFLDLFSISPMGITSLSFMTAVLIVLSIQRALPRNRFFLPVLLTILASLIALFVDLLLLRLLGHPTDLRVAATLPPVALLHGALILPVYWFMYVLNRRNRPRRVEL
ncbi:MAG: rod shape-determining protein MreD [Anaerolineae bacterium]